MRDFLLGILVISVLAAIGLGGFGVYSWISLDNQLEELSDQVGDQSGTFDDRLGELSGRLNSKFEELTQQVEELQERQLLVPYRVFIPPQVEVSNIEKLETSISFVVRDDFSIPAITVYPGQVYEFPAGATVEITYPYLVGGVEFRDITVKDATGEILLTSEPISVAEATIIEIEPTA